VRSDGFSGGWALSEGGHDAQQVVYAGNGFQQFVKQSWCLAKVV
jgi:hypothetical protein